MGNRLGTSEAGNPGPQVSSGLREKRVPDVGQVLVSERMATPFIYKWMGYLEDQFGGTLSLKGPVTHPGRSAQWVGGCSSLELVVKQEHSL